MRAVFLDMGSKMYGDCIYLDLDGFTILIDGGHPEDFAGGAAIPAQLKRITGQAKIQVDLLVVTHSHDDHVGCLPRMVEAGVLTAKFALVSDPAHRWSDITDADATELGETGRQLLDVLGEELPNPALDRDGFDQALDVARDLKTRYRQMLTALKQQGTKVVRYQTDPLKPITDALKGRGVKILGPTKKHLALCKAALNGARDAVRARIRDTLSEDAPASLADLYVRVFSGGDSDRDAGLDASDRAKGAINNLSIVLSVSFARKKLLLPGDMQFADPETDGLEAEMKALLAKVSDEGPYAALKTPHHTSYNGWNETLHRQTLNAPVLIHSGGVQDPSHPESSVLQMMKQNQSGHTFLRTDRNGTITLTPGTAKFAYEKSKGNPNDFTPNPGSDVNEAAGVAGAALKPVAITTKPGTSDVVRISAEIPNSVSKVTITVELGPSGYKAAIGASGAGQVGLKKKSLSSAEVPGDVASRCSGLLLVTNEERLGAKLGEDAVAQFRDAAREAGAGWVGDIAFPFSADEIQERVSQSLGDEAYRGVVLLGDYDVVAPARFDCLPPDIRAEISAEVDDPDNFVVWSDGPYGDGNADGLVDLPVSRVPDAGSAEFFWRCLGRAYEPREIGYTLRNVNRPFADDVHALLPPGSRRLESKPTRSSSVHREQLADANLYLMLHGSDFDAARFWGEEEDGHIEAINCGALPETLRGVVFAGCCWGALIGREPAYRVVTDDPPLSRRIEDSMALSALARGATAFVGCTGAHYSPVKKPYNYYGHPMHASFWTAIGRGLAPAAALFEARQTYWENLPHASPGDRLAVDELAIELKLYQQFTCLGFGW